MAQSISKTYREICNEFINSQRVEATFREDTKEFSKEQMDGAIQFARYLDSFQSLTGQLEILALYKSREIDREFMLLLIKEIGKPRATELAQELTDRHKHTVKKATKEEIAQEERDITGDAISGEK